MKNEMELPINLRFNLESGYYTSLAGEDGRAKHSTPLIDRTIAQVVDFLKEAVDEQGISQRLISIYEIMDRQPSSELEKDYLQAKNVLLTRVVFSLLDMLREKNP